MKIKTLLVVLLCAVLVAQAQPTSVDGTNDLSLTLTNQTVIPPPDLQRVPVMDPAAILAEALAHTNLDSSPPAPPLVKEIRPVPGGAVADYGLSRVDFPLDLQAQPLTVVAPGGQILAFRPTYLILHNRSTQEDVLLASITNCAGVIDGSEVSYENAFGPLDVRVSYVYGERNSLEQFIRIKEDFDLPEDWQTDEASQDLSIECWTLVEGQLDSIHPQAVLLREAGTNGPAVEAPDCTTVFGGSLRITAGGRAFMIGEEDESFPVAKSWIEADPQDGSVPRRFLIESIDYLKVKSKLKKLKKHGHAFLERFDSRKTLLAHAPMPQPNPALRDELKPMLLADLGASPENGLTIDFNLAGCTIRPNGILGWWMGEGNPNDSVGGNNGTLSGGVDFAAGEVMQSFRFRFTGSDGGVTVPDSSTLDFGPNADFSIEAWIKPEYHATSYSVQVIVDKRNTSANDLQAVGYVLFLMDGRLGAQVTANPLNHYRNIPPTGGGVGPQMYDGNWHHVGLTLDRDSTSGAILYVDGIGYGPYNQTAESGDLSNAEPLHIGQPARSGLSCYFQGLIDEVTIYNRALASGEIQAIYAAGVAGKCSSCGCLTVPSGAVGWWPADGSPNDLARGHAATLYGTATYARAMVSQGLNLNGNGSYAKVPSNPDLNVGSGNGFTVEGWFNDQWANQGDGWPRPIIEWSSGSTFGVELRVNYPSASCLYFNVPDDYYGLNHEIYAPVTPNILHHTAATYDKPSGVVKLYLDGALAQMVTRGTFTPRTALDFYLGYRPTDQTAFKGLLDDFTVYNRVLSSTEISGIYVAGPCGKCKSTPIIVTQPASVAVCQGSSATFTVSASGTPPLTYQWYKNGRLSPARPQQRSGSLARNRVTRGLTKSLFLTGVAVLPATTRS